MMRMGGLASAKTRAQLGRRVGTVATIVLAFGALVPALGARAAAAATPQLTRAAYLTDLVGTSVAVNWATDRSQGSASAVWGAVDGSGNCTPTNNVAATRTSITVVSTPEYQWVAVLALPASGSYCYRVLLGATDLLGSDPSPVFTTQVPAGSTTPFSFAVFGDWGQLDANGNNADQANLLSKIAGSGVQFALTVGDNGYPSGSQTNYGDLQQQGTDTSAIFGPAFWPPAGRTIPLFPTTGNHGFTSTTANRSTEQVNWPQSVAVTTSGGRATRDTYCCVNGTGSADYPSEWYAFDAGGARFYVLQSDWADGNTGTGTVYSDDYATHWAPGTPQYQWLAADLSAHPSGLKFAFFHYPLYSDQKAQNSDTFLQGPNSLEGLLVSNNVSIGFSGHAHMYERNAPTSAGTFPTYVTGGGGGTLQPIGELGCSAFDAYGIGWSPTRLVGSACGAAAPVPDAAARVFHFLKVSVNGSSVTVAPTDSLGRTFDVQTYHFSPLPDTIIDSAPPAAANSASAAFSFRASQPNGTFACTLDGAASVPCTSPTTYSNLSDGGHTFTVQSTAGGATDPTPATYSWTIDTQAPTQPTGVAATAPSSALVNLIWNPSTDSNGVAAYDISRNGTPLTTVAGTVTSYSDTSVLAATGYQYTVTARDAAGNASAPSSIATVTTPAASPPLFSDGFESGNLAAWTSSAGLTVQGTLTHAGSFAAQAATTNGNTYAKQTLTSTATDGYSRVWINLQSTSSQVNLLRHRTAADSSIAYLFVSASGQLGLRNDAAGTTTTSPVFVAPGSGWHELELHTLINGPSSKVDAWLDGVHVDAVSITTDLGTTPVGRVQIGDVQSGRAYNVTYDDVAFGTGELRSPPVANAGPDQSIASAATTTIDASASTDPLRQPLTYSWAQLSGPAATIDDKNAARTQLHAPAGPATITCRVTVTGAGGTSSSDDLVITVKAPK